MARNKNIQILVDLVKLLSSSPTSEESEKTLENVLGGISGGLFKPVVDIAGNPTETDLPKNYHGVFRNTLTGDVTYWVNDNGVLKSFIGAN
jgi:hypothetical protein